MQTTRLFEILYILLGKEHVTAKKLAQRFEVSTRTIYRDIDTLGMAGIPIYTEKGKGGGIRLMPDFIMNKSILDDTEQEELLTSLQSLARMRILNSNATLEKLSATFGKTATDWLEVDFSEWESDNTEIFATLKTAILEKRMIEFDYLNPTGETTRRQVEPTKLWFKSRAWYLKTFCLMRQEARTFKLTRIRNLTLTNQYFLKREKQPQPKQTAIQPPTQFIHFELKVAAAYAYRIVDDFGGGELQDDGTYLIHLKWPEDDWIYGLILSYGENIEILQPPHARELFKKKLEKINRKYL